MRLKRLEIMIFVPGVQVRVGQADRLLISADLLRPDDTTHTIRGDISVV